MERGKREELAGDADRSVAHGSGAAELERISGPTDSLGTDLRGVLTIEGCSADSLISQYGSPLFVISESTLRANYRSINQAFADIWPSDVVVQYAIKANNNFAVRAILNEEGAGGDCFGLGEMYATFLGGADPGTVVLNGSNKTMEELRRAVELGVCINVDAVDELDFLNEIARDVGRQARVNLRLVVIPEEYDPSGIASNYSWGFPPDDAVPIVKRIMESDQLEFEGYHMHLGRLSPDPDYFASWARLLGEAVVMLHTASGFVPRSIDVGGGFPRRRDIEAGHDVGDPGGRNYLNPHAIGEYAQAVCSGLLGALTRGDLPVPRLCIEPGRYIVGSASILLATVGVVKSHSGRTWVNVDASINNLMMRETRDYAYWVMPASKMSQEWAIRATVSGPLCVGKPLAIGAPLPLIARGDLLAFLDAGMYSETLSTQMNGVPRPATVLVSGARDELIKRRETISDVFSQYVLPERFGVRQGRSTVEWEGRDWVPGRRGTVRGDGGEIVPV